jgi:LacI family transcriptional regulator
MSSLQRVTIRDIAERAQVHFTTVSLALRNSPRLKAETRETIQRIAEEMGYRPDPMLAALNAYRLTRQPVHYQGGLAWIHNWPSRETLYSNEIFNQYYLGAKERAQARGYQLEEFWLGEPGMTIERMHRILRARNIQGALLAPLPVAGQFLPLRYDELSAVAFGYSMRPSVLHLVTNHHVHTMQAILDKAIAFGYLRIGLSIRAGWNAKIDHGWQAAMLVFQANHPALPKIPIFWDTDKDPLLARWIERHSPELVISSDDVATRLDRLGYRVPKDIAFASPFLRKDEKHLSGVHENDFLIGQIAVDEVIGMLHRGETGIPETPIRTLVEGVWIPGSTLPPKHKLKAVAKPASPRKKGRGQVARS